MPGSDSTGWDVLAVGHSPRLELSGLMCYNSVASCRVKSSMSVYYSKL